MATQSYPAVGDGGLTDAQWSDMYGSEDGIIEDYVGNACSYFRFASTDMLEIRPGKVSVNGYILNIETATQLYVPPVVHGSPAKTWYVAAMYDPALNVAETDGNRSELGPCRLVLVEDINEAGGKRYTILWRLVRSSIQTLNETEITDYRVWKGPTGQVAQITPGGEPQLAPGVEYPKGSRLFYIPTDNEWLRVWDPDTGGQLKWQSTKYPVYKSLPLPSSLTSLDTAAQYGVLGSEVSLVGTVRRASGAPLSAGGRDVVLCTMPVGVRPFAVQRFQCPTSLSGSVEVSCFASGNVTLRVPTEDAISWVDLSSIRYRRNST